MSIQRVEAQLAAKGEVMDGEAVQTFDFSNKVKEILSKHNQLTPPINVFNIALNEGLDLKFLSKRKVKEQHTEGQLAYITRKKMWAIYYNGDANVYRQRFTVAHELGHYFIHKSSFLDTEDTLNRDLQWDYAELQANQFGAELLMPVEMVLSEGKKYVDKVESKYQFVLEMAYVFMVSRIAMQYRLKNLQILPS